MFWCAALLPFAAALSTTPFLTRIGLFERTTGIDLVRMAGVVVEDGTERLARKAGIDGRTGEEEAVTDATGRTGAGVGVFCGRKAASRPVGTAGSNAGTTVRVARDCTVLVVVFVVAAVGVAADVVLIARTLAGAVTVAVAVTVTIAVAVTGVSIRARFVAGSCPSASSIDHV